MAELPKRLPLVISPDNRDDSTAKDAKLVNGFMEKKQDGTYELYSRPGYIAYTQPSGGAATGRGTYNWMNDVYSIFGSTLYKNTTSIGTVGTSGGVYRFTSSSGATPRLVLGDGVDAYTYDGTTFAAISDGDFPATFYKGWAYLDKTVYVMTSPNKIYGSDLDNPTSWDPLNLINAQVESDTGIGLDKQLVYVVAFKQWTTEVFYDAQNATGSPLGTVQGAKVNYGCANIDTVQDIDGILYWVCTNRNSSPQVLAMENLKPLIISTSPIERLLDEVDLTNCASWTFKEWGHWFYVVTFINSNLTLVYDIKEKRWAQWTDTDGNYFPIVASTFNSSGQHVMQHQSNGRLYIIDPEYATDNGDLFTTDIYTPNFDGGTRRRKQLNFMWFVGDRKAGSVLQVRHSDDDYQSWSNFRSVNMNTQRPFLDRCGTFERRAYNLRHRCNARLRMEAIELDLALCIL